MFHHIPIKGNYQKNEPPVNRLSDAEFRARLHKGLYFKCNEKYSQGHRCKIKEKRELMLFILNEEESSEEGTSEGNTEEVVELKQLDITEGTEIELNITEGTEMEIKRIIGFSSKGTMKLKDTVKGKEVVVSIDSGATHNFIHQTLVEEKHIVIEKGTHFGVTIGNGTRAKERGCVRGLS